MALVRVDQPQRLSVAISNGNDNWLLLTHRLGIDIPPDSQLAYPINRLPEGHLNGGMGRDVFILGFPLGIRPVGLPIWKRGSLASEPQIPEESQPYYLIDTASRPGMSGAPVIERVYSYEVEPGNWMKYGFNGKSCFLGVYSGRFATDALEDAQLGIVWPVWHIQRIVKGQRRDTR